MNHEHDRELLSEALLALDACRPGSDDHRLAEVAAALARESSPRVAAVRRSIEKIDRAVTAATQQVPVPEGLADRILAGLEAKSLPTLSERPSRPRRFALIGAGMAMAASLLIAVVVWSSRETVDVARAEAQAREFFETDDHGADFSEGPFPTSLPSSMISSTVTHWRKTNLFHNGGVAYALVGRRAKGTLYVLPARSLFGPRYVGLPANPQPQSTLGMVTAAWTDGSQVYIMVIKGSERDFWSFFSRQMA